MTRDVRQQHLENETGDRVQIGGEGVAAEAQRFERNGTAARERIDHQRRVVTAVGRPHQVPAHLQVGLVGGHVPVGERADEPEQRRSEIGVRLRRLPDGTQELACLPLEFLRAVRVARVGE